MAEPTTCDLLFDAGQLRARPSRSANRSAISERVAQGNSSQFNSLDFYSCGSGPGGRWFKSTRPDHFSRISDLQHGKRSTSAWRKTRRSVVRRDHVISLKFNNVMLLP